MTTGRLYRFRHKTFNYNGASDYSDVLETLSCVEPAPPGKPVWVTSTTSSITFIWDDPVDDGGCPIREYQVFRDNGNGHGDLIINRIHENDLNNKPQANGLIVTDLPVDKLGSPFVFKVRVITDYSPQGIDGVESDPLLFAGKPAKPPTPPTRNDATNNMQIVMNIASVA